MAYTDKAMAPIIVLCYSRSGSTLLRYILNAHPELLCPPEMHLLITSARLVELYANALYSTTIPDMAGRRAKALTDVRASIHGLMGESCRLNGKSRWCEKSVSTIDYVGLATSLFPRAKYICLHRNAFDFQRSALDALQHNPDGSSFGFDSYMGSAAPDNQHAVLNYWCDKTRAILDFEQAHPDGCIRLLYEDLVLDPVHVLSGLFAFLGLDWDAGMLDRVFSADHGDGPGDWKIRSTKQISADSVGRYGPANFEGLAGELIHRISQLHRELAHPAYPVSLASG